MPTNLPSSINRKVIGKLKMERESEQIILKDGRHHNMVLSISKGISSVMIPDYLTGGQWKYYRTSDIDNETSRIIFR